jgi:hypothetical protein
MRFAMFLLMLLGCPTEPNLSDDFQEAWCREQTRCDRDQAAYACQEVSEPDSDSDSDMCSFNKETYKACVDGAWTCDDDGLVVMPDACFDLCD